MKRREPFELLQGTLDVLVLKTLAAGSLHGFGISRSIRARTGGALDVQDAPLYKALRRLEAAGCVEAEWSTTENARRARWYSLTPAGRKRLAVAEANWRRYVAAVFQVLAPA